MGLSPEQLKSLEDKIGKAYANRPTAITESTKVLLSFGSREGGFNYAVNLRERLMAELAPGDAYSVYLDAKSATEHPAAYTNTDAMFRIPIWREIYKAAISNCKAMIFMVTKAWAVSGFCEKEYEWWRAEDENPPIIVMQFSDAVAHLKPLTSTILASGASKLSGKGVVINVPKNSDPISDPTDLNPEIAEVLQALHSFGIQ